MWRTLDAGETWQQLTLDGRWPGLVDRLCEPGPRLRPHILVFVDRVLAELATPVGADNRIDVLTAVTGG